MSTTKENGNKVVFINRFFYPDHSATSQLLSDVAFYLAENGHNVSVVCSRQGYDGNDKALKKYEEIKGVKVYRVTTTNFGRLWLPGRVLDYVSYFCGMVFYLFKILGKGDTLVVKTDPPLTSVLTILIAKIKKVKQINWVQDLFPEVLFSLDRQVIPKFFQRLIVALRNWSFVQSDLTVAIGNVMQQKLEHQGVPKALLTVIPNWSDGENVKPVSSEQNHLIDEWGLRGKFIIGYSGNMGRVHDFTAIVEAAEILRIHLDVVFVFIGGGAQKAYLENEKDKRKLSNVHFFPYQAYEDLSNSLSVPDIHLISLKPEIEGYCVPSKYYGIIASGSASIFIGDANGEIAQMMQNENTGIQVNACDGEQLAIQILFCKDNPHECEKFSQNALKSYKHHYNREVSLKLWERTLLTK